MILSQNKDNIQMKNMSKQDIKPIKPIQLIPYNMRREEMMSQILLNLEQLTTISDNIFKRIDDKIDSINGKLLDMNQRHNRCVQRIQQIRQLANKATKVYANYKYPKEEISSAEDFSLINRFLLTTDSGLNSDQRQVEIHSKHIPFDDQLLKEKTQFYSIPKTCVKNDSSDLYDITKSCDPLGPIPWHRITSVSSLLVFNTADNPFLRRSQGLH